MGAAPVGVQCPISSSLGEFPRYWDWLWCPGFSPVLVSIALPFAFHRPTWCFSFVLICHCISDNYHIYHLIFRIAALNVNNVPNYFSNNHDLSLNVDDLC